MVKVEMFNAPQMVEFVDNSTGEVLYGIGLGDGIICACCGSIFALDEVTVTKFLPWVNMTEFFYEEI